MSRGLQTIAFVAGPLLLAAACSEPFTPAADSDPQSSAAGAPDESSHGGLVGLGGTPGVVAKPSLGGSANGGDATSVQASGGMDIASVGGAAGAASDVEGAGSPGAAGAAGAPPVVGARCPELAGEKLVLAAGFCIDESEVTVAHYQAFVDSHPSVALQPAACTLNTSFANNCKSNNPQQEPVRCVDWCDAHAYCQSVGKHLCGSGSAVAMPYDAPPTSLANQWYAACSHAGDVAYPYGNDYNGAACWGADRPPAGAPTVKTSPACVGGYEGLWDMSGGLAEWVDSCNAEKGMSDACHIRGGSFSGTAEQLRCDWQSGAPRNTTSNYIGFRCCADLVP